MPELPEVEVVRRGLERWVTGRRIAEVTVAHPRAVRRHALGADNFESRLRGRTFGVARRRGKYLWLPLDSGDALVAHLGMSGQLLVQPRQLFALPLGCLAAQVEIALAPRVQRFQLCGVPKVLHLGLRGQLGRLTLAQLVEVEPMPFELRACLRPRAVQPLAREQQILPQLPLTGEAGGGEHESYGEACGEDGG